MYPFGAQRSGRFTVDPTSTEETIKKASAVVNEVLRNSPDCEAAKPLLAEAYKKIEARDTEATAKTDATVAPGPPATVKTEDKQTLPVRRVKVDTVKMLAANCREGPGRPPNAVGAVPNVAVM